MNNYNMPGTHHPSSVIDKKIIDQLREYIHEAERLAKLPNQQLDLIYQEKWFKMFVPKAYGGLELSLPEILKIEECLSWCDGSLGWVVTLCSGAGWFVGFIDPALATDVFKNDLACLAGSGALTGVAEITKEGFEITGTWKYASGALHATYFTMNCYHTKDGQPLYNPDGTQTMSSFIVKSDKIKLHKTWHSMGMIATGSHSFEVSALRVDPSQSFTISPHCAVLKNPVYHYPFLQLAETTLAVNMSGMALRFIELAESILTEPTKSKLPQANTAIDMIMNVKLSLNTSRLSFFSFVEDSWKELILTNDLSLSAQASITKVSQHLVQTSREAVSLLYPHCGLMATDTSQEINIVWRNFNTAGQHALFKK